ncbi:hypothetical protein WG904_19395 [Pedobacter sp. Du54]|uniref:hypothetical protein n=1 Tax=Pedobacter anseongensis TaxID=3133439 RepID=UPI0030A92F83
MVKIGLMICMLLGFVFESKSQTRAGVSEVKVVDVLLNVQQFDFTSKSMMNIGNTLRFVYIDHFTMIISKRIGYFSNLSVDNKSGEVDQKLSRIDTTYMVHVFSNASNIGLKFNLANFREGHPKIIKKDSLLKHIGLNKENLAYFEMELGTPESAERCSDTLIERYSLAKHPGKINDKKNEAPDSVYRYYSKNMNDIPFVISSKLDSLSSSKYFSSKIIFNPVFGAESTSPAIPRREWGISITRVNNDQVLIYQEILRKFNGEIGRLGSN